MVMFLKIGMIFVSCLQKHFHKGIYKVYTMKVLLLPMVCDLYISMCVV